MNIGDKVLYVPHQCFARHKNANSPLFKDGEYAWVIGQRQTKRDKLSGETTETVTELHGPALARFIEQVNSNPSPEAWKQVAFVRPNVCWPAVVTGTWADGTVDLDVNCGGSGTTLVQNRVKVDQDGKQPDSCHTPAEGEVPPESEHLLAHAYSQIQGRGAHRHHVNGEPVVKAAS